MTAPKYTEVDRLFHRIANRFNDMKGNRFGIGHEDLVQEAAIGFYVGWENFDMSRFQSPVENEFGARFSVAQHSAWYAVSNAVARVKGWRQNRKDTYEPDTSKAVARRREILRARSMDEDWTYDSLESMTGHDIFGEDDPAYERFERDEMVERIVDASYYLPPKTAEVFLRRFVLDQPKTQISEEMAVPMRTIEWHQKKALDSLRTTI